MVSRRIARKFQTEAVSSSGHVLAMYSWRRPAIVQLVHVNLHSSFEGLGNFLKGLLIEEGEDDSGLKKATASKTVNAQATGGCGDTGSSVQFCDNSHTTTTLPRSEYTMCRAVSLAYWQTFH
ncbi:hypothetical protein AYO20_11062 [Fonsecaea nubica]|uniref:Uncharacterized protein n=1 Tax=Fonsecaea nubica TaxID=856822 RepID=A0A178C2V3_9EURO|nr:hypothetical protein AYO20_11062 [Fonsecaea nubica]OAL23071.1 hypothetical protein AYO20_11062 [Fonsecaea nubica]